MQKKISKLNISCLVTFTIGLNIIALSVFSQNIPEKVVHPDARFSEGTLLNQSLTGFSGIWYANQPSGDEYVYKYSGGLGTYTANHNPMAIYSPEVQRTFFCYGAVNDKGSLIHAISYFDHKSKKIARPVGVIDKNTTDAHDNPVISIDKEGFIWLFSTSHGTSRPSYIHRSISPYDISRFEPIKPSRSDNGQIVPLDNFSYLQVYYNPENGFIGLFTHYVQKELKYGKKSVRVISFMTSHDGIKWSDWKDIASIEEGHYQTSFYKDGKTGTSFNYHPNLKDEPGLNYRTNLYYLQNKDFSDRWHTVDGKEIDLPLTEISNEALVSDYASRGLNVYINDLAFDESGNPAILYITSKGYQAGPVSGPQNWNIAHWNGSEWEINFVTSSDNNYDMGSLYIEEKGLWRIIGPSEPGPQLYNTGGEIVMWVSNDEGKTWIKAKLMTIDSQYNHSYVRKPVDPDQGFYSFWADGDGRKPSKSRLYFSTKEGDVYQLPEVMERNMLKLKPFGKR